MLRAHRTKLDKLVRCEFYGSLLNHKFMCRCGEREKRKSKCILNVPLLCVVIGLCVWHWELLQLNTHFDCFVRRKKSGAQHTFRWSLKREIFYDFGNKLQLAIDEPTYTHKQQNGSMHATCKEAQTEWFCEKRPQKAHINTNLWAPKREKCSHHNWAIIILYERFLPFLFPIVY